MSTARIPDGTPRGLVQAGQVCGWYLMEQDWQEGFECSLPASHPGPHRAEGGVNDINVGIDVDGRSYSWVYEWSYDDEPQMREQKGKLARTALAAPEGQL